MTDPHKPLPPATKKPGQVPPEIPETDAPRRELPEGQLPDLPVSTDPLLQPLPRPALREIPPQD